METVGVKTFVKVLHVLVSRSREMLVKFEMTALSPRVHHPITAFANAAAVIIRSLKYLELDVKAYRDALYRIGEIEVTKPPVLRPIPPKKGS